MNAELRHKYDSAASARIAAALNTTIDALINE